MTVYIPGSGRAVRAEIDGRAVDLPRSAMHPLETAVHDYLHATHQAEEAKVIDYRLDGWSSTHACYDVYVELDRPAGPAEHRYFLVTLYE